MQSAAVDHPARHSSSSHRPVKPPVVVIHSPNSNSNSDSDISYVSNGIVSASERQALLSASFAPLIEQWLPWPLQSADHQDSSGGYGGHSGDHTSSCSSSALGGFWFWEGFRYVVRGCSLGYCLAGTGACLATDSLGGLQRLRASLVHEQQQQSNKDNNNSSKEDHSLLLSPGKRWLWFHGSAQMEAAACLALAVPLLVMQLPMLEDRCGPQALILCATKQQCDWLSSTLEAICDKLHLTVHNLFEPYPSIPESKRAEVVVGTPPLWATVALLDRGSTTRSFRPRYSHSQAQQQQWQEEEEDLEDILTKLQREEEEAGGMVSIEMANRSTRSRPYAATHVAHAVLWDLDRQIDMGFAARLVPLLRPSASRVALPLGCRVHTVRDRSGDDSDPRAGSVYRALRQREEARQASEGAANPAGGIRATVMLESQARAAASPDHHHHHCVAPAEEDPGPERKRPRHEGTASTEGNVQEKEKEDEEEDEEAGWQKSGVVLHGTLSIARLAEDRTLYSDFLYGILLEALKFWRGFDRDSNNEEKGGGGGGDIAHNSTLVSETSAFLEHQLALVFRDSPSGAPHLQSVAVLLRPKRSSYGSRAGFLMRHLAEHFAGQVFDGCVVSCTPYHQYHALTRTEMTNRVNNISDEETPLAVLLEAGFAEMVFLLERRCDDLPQQQQQIQQRRLEWEQEKTLLFQVRQQCQRGNLPRLCFLPLSPSCLLHTHGAATVMVLRNVALSRGLLLSRPTTPAATSGSGEEFIKPLAQYILEECCQYGRVLSYYVYRTRGGGGSSSAGGGGGSGEKVPTTTTAAAAASMFVEFASPASAEEAVRLFALRYAAELSEALVRVTEEEGPWDDDDDDDDDEDKGTSGQKALAARLAKVRECAPRAKLFGNSTYYAGVLQEERRIREVGEVGSSDGDGSDSDDDFEFPLLDE